MKAMIFATGTGYKFKSPLNDISPVLECIQGKPVIEHVILQLKEAGVDEIMINIRQQGEQITDFLAARNNFDSKIYLSEYNYLLDTGGGIKKAASFLRGKEPFIIHDAGFIPNLNLKKLYRCHKETNPLSTLLVSKQLQPSSMIFSKSNRLCGWYNNETGEIKSHYPYTDPHKYNEYAFSGIHILSPGIFDWMENRSGKFSLIDLYLSIYSRTNIQACLLENVSRMSYSYP